MEKLTADNLCIDFTELAKSLDYGALRHSSEKHSPALRQILSFSLKWKLAFNQFPIQDELNVANVGQNERLKKALIYFATHLEAAEKEFYKLKLKGTALDHAYPLSEKPNWALRLLYVFKMDDLSNDNATKVNLLFFIDLLTMLSGLVGFVPGKSFSFTNVFNFLTRLWRKSSK